VIDGRSRADAIPSRAMNADELRSLQAPIKQRYRDSPDAAQITLRARGRRAGAPGRGGGGDPHPGASAVSCRVETGKALVDAGLHPATGGDGTLACSGDMLLEALVACAGVTLRAVATALSIPVRGGTVSAEGDLDFRGTLGVAKDAPVGFRDIRLRFDLEGDALPEQKAMVVELTERYCVVLQTLRRSPPVDVSWGADVRAAGANPEG
jgi:uncharacterized OsmC-like protein